jgi:Tol biopolymer transport system component
MSSYRDVLERVGDRAQMPEPAFDRMLRRRDKKRRNQRISAGVVGLGVLLALVLGLTQVSANRTPRPLEVPKRLPSNGWIVYPARLRDGPAEIYLAREGVPARRIVASRGDGVSLKCPAFSPGGAMLAYREGATLVVTALDASGDPTGAERRIATQPGRSCARWSPDGRRLAYAAHNGLWVAALNGQMLQVLDTLDHVRDFEWSPDGSRIAVSFLGDGDIRLVSAIDGGDARAIPGGMPGGTLAWAPDGTRIAVGSDEGSPGIQVIDVVRNVVRTLDLGDNPRMGGNPAWSPDGELIAFVRNDRITLADPDGSGSITLPPVEAPDLSKGHVGIWGVQWSPDGKRLLSIGVRHPDLAYAVISIPVDERLPATLVSPVTLGLYFTTPQDLDWQAIPS